MTPIPPTRRFLRPRFDIGRYLAAVAIVAGTLVPAQNCRAASTLDIAIVVATTGDGADWGQTEVDAAKLAVTDAEATGVVSKGEVRLIVENAPAEDVGAAVSAYRRAIATGAPYAVIGPTWDDAAAAIAPISTDLKVVTIAPDASSGVQKGHSFPFYFSTFAPEAPEMGVLAAHLRKAGVKSVAVVYNQDPFSQQFRDAFVSAAKEVKLTVVGDFPVADPEARDFRAIVGRLKQAKPDAVFIEMTSQGAKGPFMRQARDRDLRARIVSSSTTDTASLLKEYGNVLNGLVFAAPVETPARRELTARYERAYRRSPAAPSAPSAYDATRILIAAYKAGIPAGKPLRDHLIGLPTIDGVSAKGMRFADDGRITWPKEVYEIRQIRKGAVHVVPQR